MWGEVHVRYPEILYVQQIKGWKGQCCHVYECYYAHWIQLYTLSLALSLLHDWFLPLTTSAAIALSVLAFKARGNQREETHRERVCERRVGGEREERKIKVNNKKKPRTKQMGNTNPRLPLYFLLVTNMLITICLPSSLPASSSIVVPGRASAPSTIVRVPTPSAVVVVVTVVGRSVIAIIALAVVASHVIAIVPATPTTIVPVVPSVVVVPSVPSAAPTVPIVLIAAPIATSFPFPITLTVAVSTRATERISTSRRAGEGTTYLNIQVRIRVSVLV